MSRHLYSTMTQRYGVVDVYLGYSRSPERVFCIARSMREEAALYDSALDEQAPLQADPVSYYRSMLRLLQLTVPESMFLELRRDMAAQDDSRFMIHDDPEN